MLPSSEEEQEQEQEQAVAEVEGEKEEGGVEEGGGKEVWTRLVGKDEKTRKEVEVRWEGGREGGREGRLDAFIQS